MQRLSSGLRINSAKDDAAGLSVSTKMTASIQGMHVASRNINDGISMIQVADNSLTTIIELFQQMRELSVASSGDVPIEQKLVYGEQITKLFNQATKIIANSEYNGIPFFNQNAKPLVIQSGEILGDTTTVNFSPIQIAKPYLVDDPTVSNPATLAEVLTTGSSTNISLSPVGGPASTLAEFGALSMKEPAQIKYTYMGGSATFDLSFSANQNTDLFKNKGFTPIGSSYTTDVLAGPLDFSFNTLNVPNSLINNGDNIKSSNASSFSISKNIMGYDYVLGFNDWGGGHSFFNMAVGVDISAIPKDSFDNIIDKFVKVREEIGSKHFELEYKLNNLGNKIVNMEDAKSRILDTDYAKETADLAKNSILKQANIAIKSQANQESEQIIKLIKSNENSNNIL